MKQLRKTVRRIILENYDHYDKLVTLITTFEAENIKHALLLAETMGYIEMVSYEAKDREEFVRGSFSKKETVTDHRWEFILDVPFRKKLNSGWRRAGFDKPLFGVGMTSKGHDRYVIRILEKPSDRL